MAKVTYVDHTGAAVEVDIEVGENVMRGALYNGIEGITGECGGGLSCATCHCYVDEAWTDAAGGPSSEAEAELLESAAAEVKSTSRLSCQLVVTEALDGLVVHMPEHQF
ncbi:2Fe-2S iron-sulfur cluster-binding protein [Novosphingobium sp. AP12]|uniref:2Fe-2S iron-sulfur cluster-binding protein n=1 Tax=Novosphingobium sp. AP12 TaxID=1144305 RepID=UPI0002720588|nr:2Fe-2S iron-sulfur cluster-binding protein [Novosphingobium sp. AP12]EJL28542.1 ferredoxin [Novosphingobium sp. AP12]